jgi:hypothetical protein
VAEVDILLGTSAFGQERPFASGIAGGGLSRPATRKVGVVPKGYDPCSPQCGWLPRASFRGPLRGGSSSHVRPKPAVGVKLYCLKPETWTASTGVLSHTLFTCAACRNWPPHRRACLKLYCSSTLERLKLVGLEKVGRKNGGRLSSSQVAAIDRLMYSSLAYL